MIITGIAAPLIRPQDDLPEIFWQCILEQGIIIGERSVVVVTSKVAAVAAGRLAPCADQAELEELVAAEAERQFGKIAAGFSLTESDGFVMPNAGIDVSNAPIGQAILPISDPQAFVDGFREAIQARAGVREFGVIVADSRVVPFRLGISGVALAWSGFVGVSDERGKKDLFGRTLKVSQIAVADDLASVAQIFFGQAAERVPFVLINDPPVSFTDLPQNYKSAQIPIAEDLYTPLFRPF